MQEDVIGGKSAGPVVHQRHARGIRDEGVVSGFQSRTEGIDGGATGNILIKEDVTDLNVAAIAASRTGAGASTVIDVHSGSSIADRQVFDADTFFPEFNGWKEESREDISGKGDFSFSYVNYIKK